MNITDSDMLLFCLVLYAVGATFTAIQYRDLAISATDALRESIRVACEITKNEKVRNDFEMKVVDPLLAKLKERNHGSH